jgi:hypothetical protein
VQVALFLVSDGDTTFLGVCFAIVLENFVVSIFKKKYFYVLIGDYVADRETNPHSTPFTMEKRVCHHLLM